MLRILWYKPLAFLRYMQLRAELLLAQSSVNCDCEDALP